MQRENPLHPLVGDDTPHRDHAIDPASPGGDEHPLEYLDALLLTLDDSIVDVEGIADGKIDIRHLRAELTGND